VGSQCLDCARAARPDMKTRVKYANARQHTLMTYIIIALNAAVFLYTSVKDTETIGGGLGSDVISKQQFDLGLSRAVLQFDHHWYRIITSGFLHFGIIHILFNMYLLYLLGQLLEPGLGRTRFTLLYLASLLGGSAGVVLLNSRGISGGASGAVFGLMGAATVALHRQGINILQTGIGRTLALNLVITFVLFRYISVGGHIGGMVAGALCSVAMMAPRWKPVAKWVTYAAPIAVGALSIAICVYYGSQTLSL
jgi:membrane associated rhomboid family serine protease